MKKIFALLMSLAISVVAITSCGDTKDTSNSEVVLPEEHTEVQTTEATTTTQIETTTSIPETTTYENDKIIINGKPNGKMLVPGITLGMTSDEFFEKVNVDYDLYYCSYDYYVAEGFTFADNDETRLHEMQSKDYTYLLDSTALFDLNDYSSYFYVSFDYRGILVEYGYSIGSRLDNDGNGEYYLSDDEIKSVYEKAKAGFSEIYGEGTIKQDYIDYSGFKVGCLEWKGTEIGDIILGAGTKIWDVEGDKGVRIFIKGTIDNTNKEEAIKIMKDTQLKPYVATYGNVINLMFIEPEYSVTLSGDKYIVTVSGDYFPSPTEAEYGMYKFGGSIRFTVDIDNGTCETDTSADMYLLMVVFASDYSNINYSY